MHERTDMALYNRATLVTPRATSVPCEGCGLAPVPRVHRHVDGGRTFAHVGHAQNRKRLDPWYAERGGEPHLAGKRICPACFARVLAVVNGR